MSKAIIDKVDAAMVLRKVAPEDLKLVAMLTQQSGQIPTHSIDIFKNRRGKHNKVRLWINLNLGNVRTKELFLTDEYGSLINLTNIRTMDSNAIIDDIPLYTETRIERKETPNEVERLDIELKRYIKEEEVKPVEGKLKISL